MGTVGGIGMRLVSLRQAQPGMKLGRTVFTEDGKVLLGVGMQLTERLISGLQRSGVDSVYIDDPRTEDIVVEDVIRPQTRQVAVEVIEKRSSRSPTRTSWPAKSP